MTKKPTEEETYAEGKARRDRMLAAAKARQPWAEELAASIARTEAANEASKRETAEREAKQKAFRAARKAVGKALNVFVDETDPKAKEQAWGTFTTECKKLLQPGKVQEQELTAKLRTTAQDLVQVYILKCVDLHGLREALTRKAGEQVVTRFQQEMADFYGVKDPNTIGIWCRNGGASPEWKDELRKLASDIGKGRFNTDKFFRQKWAQLRLESIQKRKDLPGIELVDPVDIGCTVPIPSPIKTQVEQPEGPHYKPDGPKPSEFTVEQITHAVTQGLGHQAERSQAEDTREQIAIARILDLLGGQSRECQDLEEAAYDLETILVEHTKLMATVEAMRDQIATLQKPVTTKRPKKKPTT